MYEKWILCTLIWRLEYLAAIFENVIAKWTFCVQQLFFSIKNDLQSSYYKN